MVPTKRDMKFLLVLLINILSNFKDTTYINAPFLVSCTLSLIRYDDISNKNYNQGISG